MKQKLNKDDLELINSALYDFCSKYYRQSDSGDNTYYFLKVAECDELRKKLGIKK